MSNDLSVNMRRGEMDRYNEKQRRRGQAIRAALTEQRLTITRPHVAFGPKGVPMNKADADYLREAARNITHAGCLGSNLTAALTALLIEVAAAVEASEAPEAVADRSADR